jgi:uncharacterized DUF497 family protein
LKTLQLSLEILLSDTVSDPDHWFDEQRFIIIGSGRILVVAHTDDGQTVRIISAREATRGEIEFYEEG